MNNVQRPSLSTARLRAVHSRTLRFAAVFAASMLMFCCFVPRVAAQQQQPVTFQLIHLAPEATLSPVAFWAGLPTGGSTVFAPVSQNISFRAATPAISGFPPVVPSLAPLANVPIATNITRVTSTNGTTDVLRAATGIRLLNGANYVFIAGLSDTTAYAPNPQGIARGLNIYTIGGDTLAFPQNFTRLIYFNATTDAPGMDFVVRELGRIVVNGMGYTSLIGDVIPTDDYTIDVYTNNGATLVNSFRLPLRSQLNAAGQRVVLTTTGFFNPTTNRNGPAFGMLAVPHTSTGVATALQTTTPPTPAQNPFGTTRLAPVSLQAIHAAADPAASSVGVWLGTMALMPPTFQFFPLVNNFPFRSATPAITSIGTLLPLSQVVNMNNFSLNITPPNQAAPTPTLRGFTGYGLQAGGNWAIAMGVLDTTRFARNPEGRSTSLTILPIIDTTTSVANSNVRVRFVNAVTDAGPLEIVLRGFTETVRPLSYAASGINANLPLSDYTFDVRQVGTTNILGTFSAEFARQGLGGKRILVAATGFISPLRNQAGPSLGLLVVVNDSTASAGNVGRSFMMPTIALSVRDNGGLTVQSQGMTISPISPNPARDQATLNFALNETMNASVQVIDAQGRTVWTSAAQQYTTGKHTMAIDTENLPQGTYIVRLGNSTGGSVVTRLSVVK
ncbi:MAG: T9SS C-terminal target domain-containing protein [Candidatus Kapaibacterium sp.]|nr:MAG: T9SS C-terminal target domain-containing protein [Candidatus Kapabacteria bacterium]